MKRLVILVLIPCSLIAMQRSKLRRAYSMHPSVDALKRALIKDDAGVLDERLENGLPYTLDRQYVLLGLPMTDAVRKRLLNAIEGYWYTYITTHPDSSISSLLFDLEMLDSLYGLQSLDYSFRLMLARLKQRLLTCHTIRQNNEYAQHVQQLPAKLPRLQSFAAQIVATTDVEVPEVYQDLLRRMKPSIYVAPPLTEQEQVGVQEGTF